MVELNKWQYFVVQQEQRILTMYFDGRGRTDNYKEPWKIPDLPKRLYIGGIPPYELRGGDEPPYFSPEKVYPFNGAIDEIRISNIARYKGGVVIPGKRFRKDKHTLALWHFDEPKGSIRYMDSSGNGNDATVFGGAGYNGGIEGNALSCDGNNDYFDSGNLGNVTYNGTIAFWFRPNQKFEKKTNEPWGLWSKKLDNSNNAFISL